MSDTATRVPLAEATEIAKRLVGLLRPSYDRLAIAGSIRRRRPDIGDIDLLCTPKIGHRATDMFNDVHAPYDMLAERLNELWRTGVVEQARRSDGALAGWGPRLKKFVYQGLSVQVQSADAECFGLWMVVRTGPYPYSHAFVTPRGQKAAIRDRRGNVVLYRDGMLPPGYSISKGFRLHVAHQFVATPEERTVFDVLGLPYIEPWRRR